MPPLGRIPVSKRLSRSSRGRTISPTILMIGSTRPTRASAGLAVRSGRFSLTASVPYVSTTGPEDLTVGKGGLLALPFLSRPSTERREVTRDGIVEILVQADYLVPTGGVNAFVAGNVKKPTAAREKGAGYGRIRIWGNRTGLAPVRARHTLRLRDLFRRRRTRRLRRPQYGGRKCGRVGNALGEFQTPLIAASTAWARLLPASSTSTGSGLIR